MKFILTILFIGSMLCGSSLKAQQIDSLKQTKIKYIGTDLSVSEKKAGLVLQIMEQYKENAKTLLANKSLTQEELKLKFSQLIDEKNVKLKKILTEQQLEKMVPASERINKETENSDKTN